MTTFPTIHTGGTCTKVLLRGYRKAIIAVGDAIAELNRIEFNQRDYLDDLTPPNSAWFSALYERQEQFRKLHDIKRELEAVVYHLQENGDAK